MKVQLVRRRSLEKKGSAAASISVDGSISSNGISMMEIERGQEVDEDKERERENPQKNILTSGLNQMKKTHAKVR